MTTIRIEGVSMDLNSQNELLRLFNAAPGHTIFYAEVPVPLMHDGTLRSLVEEGLVKELPLNPGQYELTDAGRRRAVDA